MNEIRREELEVGKKYPRKCEYDDFDSEFNEFGI